MSKVVWVARAATENAQQRVETRQHRAFCCGMQRVLAGVTAAQGVGPVRVFCWCVGLEQGVRMRCGWLAGCVRGKCESGVEGGRGLVVVSVSETPSGRPDSS